MALPYNSLIESLEEEVKNGTFTAWAFANQEGVCCAFYADEASPPEWLIDGPSAPANTTFDAHASDQGVAWFPSFDLASLSKPLLANALLRLAFHSAPQKMMAGTALAELIQPKSDVGNLLLSWAQQCPSLTLADLLNHTSGLPPWCWFGRMLWDFEKNASGKTSSGRKRSGNRDAMGSLAPRALEELTRHILNFTPAESSKETKYSDLNYFLLARVIENLADLNFSGWDQCLSTLNSTWGSHFWHASLEPERSTTAIPFFPYLHSQVVAHIYESRKLDHHAGDFGSVHDTNANILASEFKESCGSFPLVSSHAGVFGNILDVRKAIPFFLETQEKLRPYSASLHQQSTRFQWGFDTPSGALSAAGLNHWPMQKEQAIFGHLGYTGTSFWMADDGQFHILLTNRTAARRTIGTQAAPRILMCKSETASTPECRIKHVSPDRGSTPPDSKDPWQTLDTADAYALCLEQSRLRTRYWDRHFLRAPPDLSKVRRTTGQHLWSH